MSLHEDVRAGTRKALAETRIEQLRLGVDAGELIYAAAFEGAIAAAVDGLATVLNWADASIGTAFGLPVETMTVLRQWLDVERRAIVADLVARLEAVDG